MNGITLQWLQSEPMSEIVQYSAKFWRTAGAAPNGALGRGIAALIGIAALAVLLAVCLVWLLAHAMGKRRKCKMQKVRSLMTGCPITRELSGEMPPVGEGGLYVLTDIVYCGSEEIIS